MIQVFVFYLFIFSWYLKETIYCREVRNILRLFELGDRYTLYNPGIFMSRNLEIPQKQMHVLNWFDSVIFCISQKIPVAIMTWDITPPHHSTDFLEIVLTKFCCMLKTRHLPRLSGKLHAWSELKISRIYLLPENSTTPIDNQQNRQMSEQIDWPTKQTSGISPTPRKTRTRIQDLPQPNKNTILHRPKDQINKPVSQPV